MTESRTLPWTAELVDERLSERGVPLVPEPLSPEPASWSHVEAAAVLSTFDPGGLQPMHPDPPPGSLPLLLENSVPIFERLEGGKWRLQAAVRRQALERLGTRAAIRDACQRNPQADGDPLRRAFLEVADDTWAGALETLDYGRLVALLEVTDMLTGIIESLPDIRLIRHTLERAAVLRPLRELVGTTFRGRQQELAELSNYVGVLPAGTLRSLRRTARTVLKGAERPPLLVLGPGGIGKSTLLAKFMLDHVEHDDLVVFAYLDFDRPVLSAAEPASILLEASRQIAVQSDVDQAQRWSDFHTRWAHALTAVLAPSANVTAVLTGSRVDTEQQIIDEFSSELQSSFGDDVPFLLVLDTFEEVQYRSREFVDSLWRFLDTLSDRLPSLRTVLAGRAPIEKRKTETLQLSALDEEAAVGFLESHGVSDPEAARLLVGRLGCSPLTLSLAVEIMRRDQCELDTVAELTRRQRLFVMTIDHESTQVELYRRLLNHIHDPEVRKLAHPGLVLRRITPDLIRYVLAEPCGLAIDSDQEARRLFAGLRAEIALVRIADDGALEHRSDLRRAMLPLMRQDAPEAVAEIHRRAIDYHSQRDTVANRAEEIYHRLAAGEDPEEVDSRWQDGVANALSPAVGELPPRAQAYLAGRIGLEIDPSAWKAASREDLERRTEQRAHDFLTVGRAEDALKVLKQARDRQAASPLYLCEAVAYESLDQPDRALAVVDAALQPAPTRASGLTLLKLLLLAADIEASRGASSAAIARIEDAYSLACLLEDETRMLQLGARRLQLWRTRRDESKRLGPTLETIAADTDRDLSQLVADTFAGNPHAAHILAGELGAENPHLIARVADAAGLPQLRPDRVRRAIILWNHETKGRLANDAAALAVMQEKDSPSPAGAMDVLLGLLSRHVLTARPARSIASDIRWALTTLADERS